LNFLKKFWIFKNNFILFFTTFSISFASLRFCWIFSSLNSCRTVNFNLIFLHNFQLFFELFFTQFSLTMIDIYLICYFIFINIFIFCRRYGVFFIDYVSYGFNFDMFLKYFVFYIFCMLKKWFLYFWRVFFYIFDFNLIFSFL